MKKGINLFVSLTLSLIFITSMTSCTAKVPPTPTSTPETKTTTEEPKKAPLVQLDVFSASTASTTAAGIYDNTWWGSIINENVGVSLNFLPTGDQAQEKLQALMAGGELPDIVVFRTNKDVQSAIRGNMLTNLDDHLDKLPNVVKNIPMGLQYARNNLSNGTGKAYILQDAIGPSDLGVEPSWGPYLRWDLYKEVGSPVINSFDDYLTTLKKMQDLQPTNKDGKKTYGLTLWKDWDNYSMFLATELGPTIGIDSGDQLGQLPFLEVDFNTGEARSTLDKDSEYIKALNFYYKANQMGLVDPDSLTQTYATAKAKITEGRVFWSWWSWLNDAYNTTENTNASTPTGFAAVLPENTKTLIPGENNIGKNWPFAISSTTKNLDSCLAYLDFMYSTDGLQELFSGPKGVTWDINENGEPEVTADGWKYINDPNLELPNGGKLSDGLMVGSWGLSSAFINPKTNQALNYPLWPTTVKYKLAEQTALQKDWSAAKGYNTTIDYVKGNNMTLEIPLAKFLIRPMDDTISAEASRIGDIVKVNSWQMIFAKNDEEFESLYNEMVTKADGLGFASVYDWSLSEWERAKTEEKEYK